MKKVYKKIFIIIVLLTLTGCVNQAHYIQVFKNGKVNYKLDLTAEKDNLGQLEAHGITQYDEIKNNPQLLFKQVTDAYESRGFIITPLDTDKDFGVSIQKSFKNAKEFDKELKELTEMGLNNFVPNLSSSSGLFTKEYMLSGSLGYFIDEKTKEFFVENNPDNLINTETTKATLTIVFPDEITAHQNATVEGNKANYFVGFSANGTEEVKTRAVSSYTNTTLIMIVAGVGIGVVLIAGAVVLKSGDIKKLKPKKRK